VLLLLLMWMSAVHASARWLPAAPPSRQHVPLFSWCSQAVGLARSQQMLPICVPRWALLLLLVLMSVQGAS
jgi:hypothetical protein